MRILIADDHEIVRRGVRSLLESEQGWEVCGEAVDGEDAVKKADSLKPDVVVMDISMPRMNGLDATRLLRCRIPEIEVLVLSQHESREMVRQAFHAGARGYVTKSEIARNLVSAVQSVSHHETFCHDAGAAPPEKASAHSASAPGAATDKDH